jgi:hypothetical protein
MCNEITRTHPESGGEGLGFKQRRLSESQPGDKTPATLRSQPELPGFEGEIPNLGPPGPLGRESPSQTPPESTQENAVPQRVPQRVHQRA